MAVRPGLIGMVVRDMGTSLRFYRLLELEVPEGMDGEPHVDVTTPNGYRIAWDTLTLMKEIYPDFVEHAVGQRVHQQLSDRTRSPTPHESL